MILYRTQLSKTIGCMDDYTLLSILFISISCPEQCPEPGTPEYNNGEDGVPHANRN